METRRIVVKTKDSFGEKYKGKFTAKVEETKLGKKLEYVDGKTNVVIYVLKNSLQIIREGEITSKTVLNLDKKTLFNYKTPYMIKTFETETERLELSGKKILGVYTIFDNGELVNRLRLEILEK